VATITDPDFGILDSATAGAYNLCVQPVGGLYTSVPGFTLTLIEHPTFSPSVSYAGAGSKVSFVGSIDGDRVAMTDTNCSKAHLLTTTTATLAVQAIANARIYTDAAMTNGAVLKLCYATQESGYNSIDDFAELAANFYQTKFSPTRTIMGAAQKISLAGMRLGDEIGWTSDAECGTFASTPSAVKTVAYRVNDTYSVALHTSPTPGSGPWFFCYRMAGNADFLRIPFGYLYIMPEPLFSPTSMMVPPPPNRHPGPEPEPPHPAWAGRWMCQSRSHSRPRLPTS
jgi:hypothetical protein